MNCHCSRQASWWKKMLRSAMEGSWIIIYSIQYCNFEFCESFPVKVNVEYSFGKTMTGVAVVQFKRYERFIVFEHNLTLGRDSGIFKVNIAKDLLINSEERVGIHLVFTDSMSNRKINATAFVNIRSVSTILKITGDDSFKSTRPYKYQLSAVRHDGTPVSQNIWTLYLYIVFICLTHISGSERYKSDSRYITPKRLHKFNQRLLHWKYIDRKLSDESNRSAWFSGGWQWLRHD